MSGGLFFGRPVFSAVSLPLGGDNRRSAPAGRAFSNSRPGPGGWADDPGRSKKRFETSRLLLSLVPFPGRACRPGSGGWHLPAHSGSFLSAPLVVWPDRGGDDVAFPSGPLLHGDLA